MTSSVGIELVSSSARVTSVKSAKPLGVSELETSGPGPSEYPLLEKNSDYSVLLEPYSEFFGK